MCWLNDYRFKKRGHFSSDLCISRLCIFSMYLILSDRNKNSTLFSIWKCIFGICLFDWYPSEVTHRLQVENLCKTRFRMFFFSSKEKVFWKISWTQSQRWSTFSPLKRPCICVKMHLKISVLTYEASSASINRATKSEHTFHPQKLSYSVNGFFRLKLFMQTQLLFGYHVFETD